MLILEEAKETHLLESMLRKLKFDVEVVKTTVALQDKFLQFRPDLAIVTAKGKKINGIDIARKVNAKNEITKFILAISPNFKIKPQEFGGLQVAGFLETPINPAKVLELISQIGKLDLQALKETLISKSAEAASAANAANANKESTFVKSKEKPAEDGKWIRSKTPSNNFFAEEKTEADDDLFTNTAEVEALKRAAAQEKSTDSIHIQKKVNTFNDAEESHDPADPHQRSDRGDESVRQTVKGTGKYTSEATKALTGKFLPKELPKQSKMDRERIQREVSRIRTEGEEPDLDESRRDFVRALYKKG